MKYKVFGGPNGRNRMIVIAKTKKRAVELLGKYFNISASHFRSYWTETGNKLELSFVETHPEKILIDTGKASSPNFVEYDGRKNL